MDQRSGSLLNRFWDHSLREYAIATPTVQVTLDRHFNADRAFCNCGRCVYDRQRLKQAVHDQFECIPAALPFKPARETPRPRIEGRPIEVLFSLNTTAAATFDVGQTVYLDYETRGLPPLGRRVYVIDMKRAEGD